MQHVLHITHKAGGGTKKYIDDLMKLTGYEHTIYHGLNSDGIIYSNTFTIIHVHSFFPYEECGWGTLMNIKWIRWLNPKVKLFVTVHDYNWLFVNNIIDSDMSNYGFTTEYYTDFGQSPHSFYCYCTHELFSQADKVIMPSRSVYLNYSKFLGPLDRYNVEVVPHCDMPVRYQNLWIPTVNGRVNVAFIGGKGIDLYTQVKTMVKEPIINFIEYPEYKDEELIETLHRDDIHVILWPSRLEESYCYALTRLINSGIPIVYIRRGSFADRLPEGGRFFGTTDFKEIIPKLFEAVRAVMSNNAIKNYEKVDETVQLNDWYKQNYC